MAFVAAKAAMQQAGVDAQQVEETIFGNARQAGGGPNAARPIPFAAVCQLLSRQ
jgi:acetyl-CoA C-acetyltransferase